MASESSNNTLLTTTGQMSTKTSAHTKYLISSALSHLETEYSRVATEQTAFDRFGSRIETISPDRIPSQDRRVGYEQHVATQTLAAVREAYTETVMNVPHYEDDYNDTYAESLTEEFGPEIAVMLTESDHFLPAVKSKLIAEIDTAIQQRETFQQLVDRERQSLRSAATEIRSVSDRLAGLSGTDFESVSFGALDAFYRQTDVLITACDEIAADRQDDLVAIQRLWRSNASIPALLDYFYQLLSVTYPVLATLGELGETIARVRGEIEAAITYL